MKIIAANANLPNVIPNAEKSLFPIILAATMEIPQIDVDMMG